jgi:hypothetical protein
MSSQKPEKKTKVFNEEFKGNEMFSIWLVDEADEKSVGFPVISLGKVKARAILKHIEELKKFVGEN